MSILSSNHPVENQVSNSISRFLSDFQVIRLFRACGCVKTKGISVEFLFTYILGNAFRSSSFYMQQRMQELRGCFSKNTYYRFLANPHVNWLHFTTRLAVMIIEQFLKPLTSENRKACFVIDDSLYERTGYKRTELAARVFDHVSMQYKKGFRLLTLGWTDGASFLPVNSVLFSSTKDENILGKRCSFDHRTLSYKRQKMACEKATTVMIHLLKEALDAGASARYVLFDSWFSSPRQLLDVLALKLHTIAMIKRSSKRYYEFEGKRMTVEQIFAACKKRRGRSRYLLSVPVKISAKDAEDREKTAEARIVCVRNRQNRKDWIALISTDMSLSEEEIIRLYGRRWDIEMFFKTCKSYLHLRSYHGLSYDVLTAHVAFVFTRYMILSVTKRKDEDERAIGELFYLMVKEIADVTFQQSMIILQEVMLASIKTVFHATDKQLQVIAQDFVNRLPEYMRSALQKSAA